MTRQRAEQLADALRKRFDGEVEFEAISPDGRYRFAVTSRQFENMPHLDRQDALWLVADQVLAKPETLDISLILAFAPSELVPADQ